MDSSAGTKSSVSTWPVRATARLLDRAEPSGSRTPRRGYPPDQERRGRSSPAFGRWSRSPADTATRGYSSRRRTSATLRRRYRGTSCGETASSVRVRTGQAMLGRCSTTDPMADSGRARCSVLSRSSLDAAGGRREGVLGAGGCSCPLTRLSGARISAEAGLIFYGEFHRTRWAIRWLF